MSDDVSAYTERVGSLRLPGRNLYCHPLTDSGTRPPTLPATYRNTETVLALQAFAHGVIEAPEGEMTFEPGDYIVTDDPPTHAWPVKREVFERTYEEVP